MTGFEPANGGVKVLCLTTWLHRYIKNTFSALITFFISVKKEYKKPTNHTFVSKNMELLAGETLAYVTPAICKGQ